MVETTTSVKLQMNVAHFKSHSKRNEIQFEAAPSFNTKKTTPSSNATVKENKFYPRLENAFSLNREQSINSYKIANTEITAKTRSPLKDIFSA